MSISKKTNSQKAVFAEARKLSGQNYQNKNSQNALDLAELIYDIFKVGLSSVNILGNLGGEQNV